jgi:hypothetical protein
MASSVKRRSPETGRFAPTQAAASASVSTATALARQKADFRWYVKHQDALLRQYDGKVIAIKDGVVLGAYESPSQAVRETAKAHEVGTFIVQRVTPGDADYTQTVLIADWGRTG